ncbi:MAG: hypothetical protein KAS39_08710 [Actinomycetia bacterium]|nr:hypothetical protein [Actinomycetes bacterium]
MRKCFELKGCPASHYMECPAYRDKINCWEIKKGCLCHYYPECDSCLIYELHREDLRDQETTD